MHEVVAIQKAVGETPLTALERYRATRSELDGVPMAYAGRLDPMASGLLLILIGEACKEQKRYHALDKEYRVSILFGVRSDTGDVLGRIKDVELPATTDRDILRAVVHGFSGKTVTFPYPVFSAKTVTGKPLHQWALEERLDEITIPEYTACIYTLSLVDIETRSIEHVVSDTFQKIELIPTVTDPRKELGADFRRGDIRSDWNALLKHNGSETVTIAHIRCVSGSGLYMRTLAEAIGAELNLPALAFSIHRTWLGRRRALPVIGKFGLCGFSP